MPTRPKRPCNQPGCPEFAVEGGRCTRHKREPWAGTVKNHGFKSGWEWTRIRQDHVREHPFCTVCGKPVEEVHQPVKGSAVGLVSLCKEHHKEITVRRRKT